MKVSRNPKQSRWALVLAVVLIVTSQLGCAGAAAPVAAGIMRVVCWIGQKAAESAVIVGIERVFDYLFGQRKTDKEMGVVVDPANPLLGRCAGPVTLVNADDRSKTYLLVDFPVFRYAIGGQWQVDPDHLRRIENALKTR